ncbi:hypothetical protein PHMEG_00021577 [Phytophthora megakarya]|uniref:Uncharacterized protein n=1 Tax=Phytophthora megakarya TaxID=4795 RepID=A0A225VL98_9STRA|nr:hypothetical protein PHMEG_00021577 [Phytophthora megakarya]
MATVPRSTAINDKKLTAWRSENKALGLLWDTTTETVSIPEDKLTKALRLTESLIATALASTSELNKLLGVFCHVSTCFPPARDFYQRQYPCPLSTQTPCLQKLSKTFVGSRLCSKFVGGSTGSRLPNWRALQSQVFTSIDASGTGLCALDSQRPEFIRVQYTQGELQVLQSMSYENSINIESYRVRSSQHFTGM